LLVVDANAQVDEENDDDPRPVTPEELSEGAVRLLNEVNETLATDRWAILDTGTEHVKWLFYGAAALRHCCRLLYEMEAAAKADLEFSVRLLGRAHLETWLVGLYIHYGGFEALTRVAQDTRYDLEATTNDAAEFDKWLKAERKAARESVRKVEQTNKGIQRWNEENPDKPAKPLLEAAHIPRLRPSGVDFSDRIADFASYEAHSLPVSEVVDSLTKLGIEKGFGNENFRPLYLIYRVLSSIGTHPTFNVFDAYFVPGNFIRVAPVPINGSAIDTMQATALHATAFLASAVLGGQGSPTPVADEIRMRLEPDPSGRSAWAPSV
jgi:hypothetical protein